MVFTKVKNTICLLHKVDSIFPRVSLVSIFKTFVQPHLDYCDILYGQAFNRKSESIQHNAYLVINRKITGVLRKKLQELGLELLQLRSWCRKLCFFNNVLKNHHLSILNTSSIWFPSDILYITQEMSLTFTRRCL